MSAMQPRDKQVLESEEDKEVVSRMQCDESQESTGTVQFNGECVIN
jgi:hypothetical protein